ncbi:Fic/DOC family protein [Romboutsia ilealis]|uniref:Fic/DOC family protein n=1 Tax=Romboutsia ilealis TaxID=1115758 RepID=UPI002573F46D|nr:Fic family protein [Romboutsia ilealis]
MLDKYYYEYETDSEYCYPRTYVLKNKLNITDENELKSAERSITSLRMAQLTQNPLEGKLDFNYLKNIHKFIFGDIYEWAGTIRTVNISKGNSFCRCEFIEEQMESIMRKLEKENYLENLNIEILAERLAYYIGEINAIHPFREGNGRAQRMFIEFLALKNGFLLDFAKISNEEMLEASVQTFNLEYKLMSNLLLRALSINE